MTSLKDFFHKYGTEKQIQKWDFLYKSNKKDTNIYFIEKWKFILQKDNQKIALIEENEISWEKSFLNNMPKPIDAKAITNSTIFYLTTEDFEKLDNKTKEEFLRLLTLFISDRVYLLNSIIDNISFLSNFINRNSPELSLDYFKKLFNKILDIKSIFIYETYENSILALFTSEFNPDIENKINNLSNRKEFLNIENNNITFKIGSFIFYINGNFKQPSYIVNNTLIHSLTSFKYLAEKIRNLKNEELNNLLK